MDSPLGIVLGSGLGSLVERLEISEEVAFTKAGLPASGVPGHEGKFLVGNLAGREVAVMCGRVHLYEGHEAPAVTRGVRWLAGRGVRNLILTNAAGGLDPGIPPGSWMVIEDHLNLTGTSPLEGGPEFLDLSRVYDAEWRRQTLDLAARLDFPLARGVYAGQRGPQYETPAEVRMLRTLGADAVGMSTVLEAIQARAMDLNVLGLSCLTNLAAGLPDANLDHQDVIATGKASAEGMIDLIEAGLGDDGWSL